MQLPYIEKPVCYRCGMGLSGQFDARYTCRQCEKHPPTFDQARSPWWYTGLIQRVVKQFKYKRRWRLGRRLADAMAAEVKKSLPHEKIDAVAPVPLHGLKRRLKGFDHADELAQDVARSLARPYVAHMLRRTRWTQTQTRLRGSERMRNVSRAFVARQRLLENQNVLLVDDVLTSGETANACALALKAAGARQVFVITAARAPLVWQN